MEDSPFFGTTSCASCSGVQVRSLGTIYRFWTTPPSVSSCTKWGAVTCSFTAYCSTTSLHWRHYQLLRSRQGMCHLVESGDLAYPGSSNAYIALRREAQLNPAQFQQWC